MIHHTAEFDIERELESIIEKYNLDRHYPAYRTSRQACAYIKKWIASLSDNGSKSLFIGMDERALKLINSWIIGDNVSTLQISSVEKLDNHMEELQNTDKIYVVSYTRTIEILHWLWRHDYHAESIYDVLENQHIYLQMEFYRFFTPLVISSELSLQKNCQEESIDGSSLTLYEYYYQKKRLQNSAAEEDVIRITEKLFFLAICMKNFIEAEKIMKIMPCNGEYEQCWHEIEVLLNWSREIISQKKQRHIVIYWLDALSNEDAERLQYLQEQRSHSLCFQNAFTETPFTNPVFRSLFYGIRQVDDLGYRWENKKLDDSPVVKDIIDNSYDLSIISGRFAAYDRKYNRSIGMIAETPCSEIFWNLMVQITQSKQPTVFLAHAFSDMHPPRLSVRRNRFEEEYLFVAETIEQQFEELNAQLCFYDKMLGNYPCRIYMSDHGFGSETINKLHVLFQIYYNGWKKKEINKLFCFEDFPKILHRLLMGEEIDDTTWDRDYVAVQDVDFHNSSRLKPWLKTTKLDLLPTLTAYKGVVTSDYAYIRFKTSDEIFHKWSDGEYVSVLDFNNPQKDTALFKELRDKAGGFPEELDTDPEFEDAKNTYIIYENVKRTVLKAAELLNKKIVEYPDSSIILRPGGITAKQLYGVLSEDSRKRIGGIIDRNAECVCKDLGYRIYQPEDALPSSIKVILLSGRTNQEELQSEAKKIYNGLEIIDIYQYWRDCGYSFTRDFWFGLESDRDIEFLKD